MEVNPKRDLTIRDVTATGLSLTNVRRLGGQIYPDVIDWYTADRKSVIPIRAGLALALVKHLSDRKVIDEAQAISAVSFFRNAVTRYEADIVEALRSENDDLLPIVMLEVINGRWIRLTNSEQLFDLDEQMAVKNQQKALELPIWSHSVCLLPLYLQLCGAETCDDELEHENIEAA